MRKPGVLAALGAAALFGAGTPLAKAVLHTVDPWLLAGLLYLGSGAGLLAWRGLTSAPAARLPEAEVPWLAGAILAGGVVAPVLLMLGLQRLPASESSLLLNAEGVFTALLAWFAFRENFDRRIALGMLAIVAGAAVLSWQPGAAAAVAWPALAVLGACLAWALDNNLTRKVSLTDATWIACVKGLAAGAVNLVLAFALGASPPPALAAGEGMAIGLVSYGISLSLFVVALRPLGTARPAAYFSIAPFFGALLAVAMGEGVTLRLFAAGALMAAGVVLHLRERHEHEHTHDPTEHEHTHEHDEHHAHSHDPPVPLGTLHSHRHRHEPLTHAHPHYPDAHHRHDHS